MYSHENRIPRGRAVPLGRLGLSPNRLCPAAGKIVERRAIGLDDYSRGGVVAELEERMAALLGKERRSIPIEAYRA